MFKLNCVRTNDVKPTDESPVMAPHVSHSHTHMTLSPLVCCGHTVSVCACVCVCVCVFEPQCGSHSPVCSSRPAVFPLLLQRITAVERASLSPQGWNACPAPRLWETLSQKSTEPLSNGIPHSQSPTPTGLLKVEVTRDSYPHCCKNLFMEAGRQISQSTFWWLVHW